MTTKRDYYEILGVQKGESLDEIKKVYRDLVLRHHPDRVTQDKKKEAEERFKEISEAYAVLSDPQKRSQYDQFGHAGIDSKYSTEDIFKGTDFESVFENMGFGGDVFEDILSNFGIFGDTGRRARGGGARRGRDMQYEIEISFEEAAFGTKKTITVPAYETCKECNGSGAKPGTKKTTCQQCNGRGQVVYSTGFFNVSQTCPKCRGEGSVIKNPCTRCSGTGRNKTTRQIEVSIPAGVDTGSRLRIQGAGESGTQAGFSGDLYLYIHVREHPVFERHGYDIICEIPINFSKAALGGEIEVPTLRGNVMMKIPEGTQSGKIFRLAGKGVKNLKGYGNGDQMVRVVVETPVNLNSEQKKLLREFENACNGCVHPMTQSFMEKVKRLFTK